ncbi:hypothetical protein GEMRC1_011840 [Eukaryota sp. GEM-RC1]
MLSAEDFESSVSELLVSDPFVSNLKAQIRHHVSLRLLEQTPQEPQDLDFYTRITYSILCQYLQHIECDLALSVFYPEAGISSGSLLSPTELKHILPRIPPTSSPLLLSIIEQVSQPLPIQISSYSQTDPLPTATPPSLQERLNIINDRYKSDYSPSPDLSSFSLSSDPHLIHLLNQTRSDLREAILAKQSAEEREDRLMCDIQRLRQDYQRLISQIENQREEDQKSQDFQRNRVLKSLEEEVKSREFELSVLKKGNMDLMDQNSDLTEVVQNLKKELGKCALSNDGLLNQLSNLNAENQQLSKEKMEIGLKVEKMERQSSRLEAQNSELLEEVHDLKTNIAHLKVKLTEARASKKHVSSDQSGHNDSSSRFSALLEELRSDNQKLRAEVVDLSLAHKEDQNTISGLRSALKNHHLHSMSESPTFKTTTLKPPSPKVSTITSPVTSPIKRNLWDSDQEPIQLLSSKKDVQVERKVEKPAEKKQFVFDLPAVQSTPKQVYVPPSDHSSLSREVSLASSTDDFGDDDVL